jgi:hypothetical protein
MATRRTNRGLTIDMDALIAKSNTNTPAVGNMRVNARGDQLDATGQVVKKNEVRVREQYRDNPRSVSKTSLRSPVEPAPRPTETKKKIVPDQVAEPDEFAAPRNQEPVDFKEVEMPNGDIEVVPVYNTETK